ncbi:hypothetical protein L9G15_16855, partial [Shewanella sp. A3A]|nr:hypothetical protein [Shewanella ferrihydritica]
MSHIRLIDSTSGSNVYLIDPANPLTLQAHDGAAYTLFDDATGQFPAGAEMVREGDDLTVEIDGKLSLRITDFYADEMEATLDPQATLSQAEMDAVLINAEEPTVVAESTDAATLSEQAASSQWDDNDMWVVGLAALGVVGASVVINDDDKDTTPPVAPRLALAEDSGSAADDGITNNPTINVSLAEDAVSWQYSVDGGATWTTGTGSSFDLPEGSYSAGQIQVSQTDAAGNTSEVVGNASAITVNQTAPQAPSLAYDGDVTVNVSLADSAVSWEYSLDGGDTWTTGTGSAFTLAEQSEYDAGQIVVRQTDIAGNVSTTGSNAETIETTPPATITVSAIAGEFHSVLQITIYDADGHVLVQTEHDYSQGDFVFENDTAYSGNILVVVSDTNGDDTDYMDETQQTEVNLGGSLRAMATVAGETDVTVNVTPLTELATQLADVTGNTISDTQVSVNQVIAELFNLPSITGPATSILDTDYDTSDGTDAAELYGQVLAALSGADSATGSVSATLAALLDAITIEQDGTVTMTQEGVELLEQGLTAYNESAAANGSDTVTQTHLALPVIINADEGLSAEEVRDGVNVEIDGLQVGDQITLHWGNQAVEYTLSESDFTPQGVASLAVPTETVEAGGDGRIGVSYTLNGDKSNTVVINVLQSDVTAPDAPAFALANDTGSSATDNITNDTTINVTLGDDAASWQYSLDGGNTWTTGSGDSFELAGDTTYAAGAIQVRQTDAAGNTSNAASNSAAITTDVTAPDAPEFALAKDTGSSATDNITNDTTVNVTLADDAASWQYSLNGGDSWTTGSGSSFELAANAVYVKGAIQVRQTDAAGNTSTATSNSAAITTDSVAPDAPEFALANDTGNSATDHITSDTTVNVTLADEAASWQYSLNGGKTWATGSGTSFELSANTSYAKGDIQVRQFDEAGNQSVATSNDVAFTSDSTAASVTLSSTLTNAINNLNFQVAETGTAYLVAADATIKDMVSLTNASLASVSVTASNTNTAFASTTLDDGGYRIYLVDDAGNISSASSTITLDTTAPTGQVLLDSLVTLTGETNTGSAPQITSVGTDGAYVVTWEGASSANGNPIYVQRFNADGSVNGDVTVLNGVEGDFYDSTPQITALGTNGAYVVTWEGPSADNSNQIYVQRFSADGSTAGDVVALNGVAGDFYDAAPQITAVGTEGAYVVTWYGGSSDNNEQIYVQRFDADGNAAGGVVALNGVAGKLYDATPQVTAVGTNGAFVVTWYGQSADNNDQIYVQRFDADGNAASGVVALNGVAGKLYDAVPQVTAVGTNGAFVVTWYGESADNNDQIYVQRFDAEGNAAGDVVALNGVEGNLADYLPQITAVGTDGAYVVTWYGASNNGNNYQIYVQRFDADGKVAGGVTALNGETGNFADYNPQITALGTDGAYVVTWFGGSADNGYQIYVQRFDAEGNAAGGVTALNGVTGNFYDAEPQITAIGTDGAYVVTWYGSSADNSTLIYVQRFNPDGSVADKSLLNDPANDVVDVQSSEAGTAYLVDASATVTSVAEIEALNDSQWNSVAVTAANTTTSIAASGLADGTYYVYVADAAGNLGQVADVITIDTHVDAVTVADTLVNADESVTFQANETGTAYLVAADATNIDVHNVAGAAVAKVNVTTANTDTSFDTSSVADNDYQIYFVDTAGNMSKASSTITLDATVPTGKVIAETLVTLSGETGDNNYPQITAVGTDGAYVVTWYGSSADNSMQIYVQRFDADGNVDGEVVALNGVEGKFLDFEPQITAVGTDGAYVVVWYGQSADNSTQIYVQRFDADGNAAGGVTALNGERGNFDDPNQQITAVGTDGAYVVTWNGNSADNSTQIYVQRFDADGKAAGGVTALNGVEGKFSDSEPQITAVGTDGAYVVTWSGNSADNGSQIYVQR